MSFVSQPGAVAVEALEAGSTIALLRKGGIRETGKGFQIKHRQILLYPTYEHQKPQLLKPEYAKEVTPVSSGWHPETVRIGSCASITDVFTLKDSATVEKLYPYHIWNAQMIDDRLKWQSDRPVSVLLLRVYCLPQAIYIPYHKTYGGCKSWIDLVEPISLDGLIPVLSDREYRHKVTAIMSLIPDHSP